MVALEFTFNDEGHLHSELLLKTIDDFVVWLEQQDEAHLPCSKDLGITMKTRYEADGTLLRELAFESRTGAAIFLKLWRRVRQNEITPLQSAVEAGQIGRAR